MKYDVIVIGAGLSGLSAAALLAKRGLSVAVVEKSMDPGGSCGIFKRKDAIFDQGAAMLYGFGDKGFNAHRFLFNCLEEPFEVVRHERLYSIVWDKKRVRFFSDITLFVEELSKVFPDERNNLRRFYRDMLKMYNHVIVEKPNYTTPDMTKPEDGLKGILRHPVSYLKFLSYMNISAEALLKKYFKNPDLFSFFDKLTSTYCYATVNEAPAIMASVMFVDNHIGGSYYPAGSTLYLPGKLEKVIETCNGDMIYGRECREILFRNKTPEGVLLDNGEKLYADDIIFSGSVWNLYGKLIPERYTYESVRRFALGQQPTFPSIVLYAIVESNVIGSDTEPIEMLVGNKNSIDEEEITVYIMSLDDRTLCEPDKHVVMAIGPSFLSWSNDTAEYEEQKKSEIKRVLHRLAERHPGLEKGVIHAEIATPRTIENFTCKNGGAVAGPKQMLGQHMLKRQHTCTEWPTLFCCGESTVLGTGTPTVTTSGIAAANAVLEKKGCDSFSWHENMKNYVSVFNPPFVGVPYSSRHSAEDLAIMKKSMRCRFCLNPSCSPLKQLDVRGVMRRVSVGNFCGAKRIFRNTHEKFRSPEYLKRCEAKCILNSDSLPPVEILAIADYLLQE